MSLTAADYFRRLFDFYPVAYDESPLLYRILNKARQDVADNFCLKKSTHSSVNKYARWFDRPTWYLYTTWYILGNAPFTNVSRVWRVYYVNPDKSYVKRLDQVTYDDIMKDVEPIGYIYDQIEKTISIVPATWNHQKNEYIDILYTPLVSQMHNLYDQEDLIPDELLDCVALRMAYMLAMNDMQFVLAEFFNNQWKMELFRSVRARG